MTEVAQKTSKSPLWFSGVCDDLYRKIQIWDQFYWLGEVHSTRLWLSPIASQPIPKPTKMAHDIPFREIELDHLLRITNELRPNSALSEEIKNIRDLWKYGKPVQGYRYMRGYWSKLDLPSGLHRAICIAMYPEFVKEILSILDEAKAGDRKEVTGKDIFEQ